MHLPRARFILQAENCAKLAARGAAVLSQQAPAFRRHNDSGASSISYSSQHVTQLVAQVSTHYFKLVHCSKGARQRQGYCLRAWQPHVDAGVAAAVVMLRKIPQ
jgi:hypothetical protein